MEINELSRSVPRDTRVKNIHFKFNGHFQFFKLEMKTYFCLFCTVFLQTHVFLTVYASLLIKYDYMYQYGTHPRWPLMLGQVKTGIIKIVTPTDLTYCFISNVVFMVLSLLSGDFRKGAKI